jgi:hypothetical protein
VRLTWQAPATNGGTALTGYDLYRRTGSGSYALVKSLGNVTTWKDTATTSGTTYTYMVKAKNSVGASAPSNEASWATR